MFWKEKKVLLTGHTGFKGSWLSLWLQQSGASLTGYALEAPTSPNLFDIARVQEHMNSIIGDICDLEKLTHSFQINKPEIVIHMAAQPIVRDSYIDPVGTYKTNVIGTANVLEAARHCDSVRAIVVITTDKCYENREWVWAYRENDRLGGYDPYSNSKACAELVVSSYRNSFFNPEKFHEHGVAIASTRAGNVIGGGDWATDRLIPDIIRSFLQKEVLHIRNPKAIRPWQHVLEPLHGYLLLAEALYKGGPKFGEGWNFGPKDFDAKPVEWIVDHIARQFGPSANWQIDNVEQPHEAQMLKLDWSKAAHQLDWTPQLSIEQALSWTLDWYLNWNKDQDMYGYTIKQIENFQKISTIAGTPEEA